MIRVLIAILLVFVLATECSAAPSLLGMCHKDWNCKATKQMLKGFEPLELSWLENTFGEKCACVDELLADERKKIIRVHLLNSPCMRNKRCGRYEVLYGETASSASRKILRRDPRFMKKFDAVLERAARRIESSKGELQCYISPCLECDLYDNARRVLSDIVSARLPGCILVDSPYRHRCLAGRVCEQHGENPRVSRPCIVDLDGTDGDDVNVSKWVRRYRKCDIAYYWEPWMNCNRGRFIDPRQRQCKYGSSIFEYTRGILCQYFYQSSDTCSR